MEDLIEALIIFKKYANHKWPTHCEHDVLYVIGISQAEVSEEDVNKLTELGFFWDEEFDSWASFRYGSA